MAHEDTHYLQYKSGDPLYDFEDEREAYDVGDTVLSEVYGEKVHTSSLDIQWDYKPMFQYVKFLKKITLGHFTGFGWKWKLQ